MRWVSRGVLSWFVSSLLVGSACGNSPIAPSPPAGPPAPPPAPAPPPPPPPAPPLRLTVERILAFGDSLTEGESSGTVLSLIRPGLHDPSTPGVPTSYPARLQDLVEALYTDQTVRVFNGGRGGEKAADADGRMQDLISQFDPQLIIVLMGVNDLNGGTSVVDASSAVEDLVRAARARGPAVLLSTLPRQVAGGRRAFAVDEIELFNQSLVRVANKEGATLVDIYPHLTEEFITPDGLHITEAGNERLAELYLDAIKAAFEVAGAPQPAATRMSSAPSQAAVSPPLPRVAPAPAGSRRRACPATRDTCGPGVPR